MAATPTFERKEAQSVDCGNLVILEADGGKTLICLKAEREGKEYVHHYLIQLDPVPDEGYCLLYIDPEDELVDCGAPPAFELETPTDISTISRSDVGYIIETQAGVFLKVSEDPKMQKFCGFVDIRTGEIKRRQERNVKAAYPAWRAAGQNGDDPWPFPEIHTALGKR